MQVKPLPDVLPPLRPWKPAQQPRLAGLSDDSSDAEAERALTSKDTEHTKPYIVPLEINEGEQQQHGQDRQFEASASKAVPKEGCSNVEQLATEMYLDMRKRLLLQKLDDMAGTSAQLPRQSGPTAAEFPGHQNVIADSELAEQGAGESIREDEPAPAPQSLDEAACPGTPAHLH